LQKTSTAKGSSASKRAQSQQVEQSTPPKEQADTALLLIIAHYQQAALPKALPYVLARWRIENVVIQAAISSPWALHGTWGFLLTDAQDRQNAKHSAHRLGPLKRRFKANA